MRRRLGLALIVCGLVVPGAYAQQPVAEEESTSGQLVAIFGDMGLGEDARAVLRLLADEAPDLVLHLGDLAYNERDPFSPLSWSRLVHDALGPDLPYLAAVGNHDIPVWPQYDRLLTTRLARTDDVRCEGDMGVDAGCVSGDLFIALSGVGTYPAARALSDHVERLGRRLASASAPWKICAWHKNQRAMQPGEKRDEVGWAAYEQCRRAGAIIVTAHEHVYARTRTLVDLPRRTVSPEAPAHDRLVVRPGSTFVVVSGLGGRSIRDQERCLPRTYPYGCNGEWASIYTSDQDARPGVLFLRLSADEDRRWGSGYFKNIDCVIVDRFTIEGR